jgi:hypothetical protein
LNVLGAVFARHREYLTENPDVDRLHENP